jgi:hypothetical protein
MASRSVLESVELAMMKGGKTENNEDAPQETLGDHFTVFELAPGFTLNERKACCSVI